MSKKETRMKDNKQGEDIKTSERLLENNALGKSDYLPSLVFDPEQYVDDFDELDLSNKQHIEFLQSLWHIMSTFVDIGWGVESVQLFLPELFEKAGQDSDKLLRLEEIQTIKPSEGGYDE